MPQKNTTFCISWKEKTCKPDFVAFAKHFICALMQIHSFIEVDGGQRRPWQSSCIQSK
jgi:hypothetical protein